MIDEKLEIMIITYNRATYLRRTLAQLRESPFSHCKITILDNCSSDETPSVCREYQDLLHKITIIRHPRNIGACPNYLRAVELSTSPYTWVLCDDDSFDFTDCSDVIDAIEAGIVNLIYTSALGEFGWERGMTTTSANLTKVGTNYLYLLSFVPSIIFKTEHFDSECIARGYRNSANLYPHFAFLKKSVQNNFSIYISKKNIVYRGLDDDYLSGLTWFTAWVNSCRTIQDRKLRRTAIYELAYSARNRRHWLRNLAMWIIFEKLHAPGKVLDQLGQIWLGFSGDQRMFLILLSPLIVFPAPLYKLIRAGRHALRNNQRPADDPPMDMLRL